MLTLVGGFLLGGGAGWLIALGIVADKPELSAMAAVALGLWLLLIRYPSS